MGCVDNGVFSYFCCNVMGYIDFTKLNQLEYGVFRRTSPYPWAIIDSLLDEDHYRRLIDNLPDKGIFDRSFGHKRAHGQKSHDRYSLTYHPDLDIPEPWEAFIAELTGKAYLGYLEDLFRTRSVQLEMHWHYTPTGCSVSPHCDQLSKIGAQIFYLNPEDEWDSSWGGETQILDDGGKFNRRSAPNFDAFENAITPKAAGNHSLIFARTRNSWHGVSEITCPDDQLRKIFLVAIKTESRFQNYKRRFDWW